MNEARTEHKQIGISIKIDPVTYGLIQDYCDLTGRSITRTVSDAMRKWLVTEGATQVELITGVKREQNEEAE